MASIFTFIFFVQFCADGSFLNSEKEAQSCIYDASWQNLYRFCCEIDEDAVKMLAGLYSFVIGGLGCLINSQLLWILGFTGVLSIRADDRVKSDKLFPKISSLGRDSCYWLVRMKKPGVEVVTKAQIADYCADTLTKVLGK